MALIGLVAGVGVAVVLFHSGPDPWVTRAVMLVLSPLWFLVVYMVLVVTVPLSDVPDRRWGELVPIGLATLAMGVDLVRFRYGHPDVAWFNMLFVWGAAHQVGWSWERLRRSSTRFGHALLLIGFTALGGLTNMGLYPRSMVGTTSAADRFSNMGPPTLPIVALLVFQIGLVVVNRDRLLAFANRPQARRFIAWLSANAMPLFCGTRSASPRSALSSEQYQRFGRSRTSPGGSRGRYGSSARLHSLCRCLHSRSGPD
jgi:hypothetical protein